MSGIHRGKDDLPNPLDDRTSWYKKAEPNNLMEYETSGFLHLQNMLDNIILKLETKLTNAKIEVETIAMPVPAHK